MDIPTGWLTSQVVLGVVLMILAVVGVAFFFRVGARQDQARGDEDGAHPGDHAHDGAHDQGAPAGDAADGRSGPGTYGPIAAADGGSVFEMEPCWMGLLPGRSRQATDASTECRVEAAAAAARDAVGAVPPAGA